MTDIEADLRREFPSVYSQPILCGAEVPAGWVQIVRELSDELEQLFEDIPVERRPVVRQIKEKLATLRFSTSMLHHETDEAIRRAEKRSAVTCQDCGLPGRMRRLNWLIATLCNECHTSR